ncbi:hypothetical protein BC936DRAFT_142827, partial [Jimgerdemannia flammicorona]
MPPTNSHIPPEILQRFNTLQTTKDQIDRDIARLRELPGPFSVQQELTSVVREAVKAFQRDMEGGSDTDSLRNAADDQDYQLVRRAVLDNLTKHEEQLKMYVDILRSSCSQQRFSQVNDIICRLQISSREAILRSKQNADAQTRIDRELLFAPSRQPGKDEDEQSDLRQRKGMSLLALNNSVEEAILRKHSDVTEQLQRTTKLMEEEVEKSEVTTRVLGMYCIGFGHYTVIESSVLLLTDRICLAFNQLTHREHSRLPALPTPTSPALFNPPVRLSQNSSSRIGSIAFCLGSACWFFWVWYCMSLSGGRGMWVLVGPAGWCVPRGQIVSGGYWPTKSR